ncbi:MAG TPA: hypothetical protein VMU17_07295 [Elusimicrobiota bacterium]|nr:hypothetical protein [Elusimicrobiota bacterium]
MKNLAVFAGLILVAAGPLRAGTGKSLLIPTTGQEPVSFVEQEVKFTTAPFVAQPPPMVHLPEVIVEKDQWRGVQCGVTEPREAVFRHDDKWRSFWERGLAPYSSRLKTIPEIDFAKEMVVAVFLGDRDTPNHEVEILSIKPREFADQGKKLVVRYREVVRMEGVWVPPFRVQPFHMRRVPVWSGPIVFEQVKR